LPAGRGGDPRDFGRIAAFLCSEPANYLSGVALQVEGGADSSLL
jgi:3-oxoacyl-[acyl-carrier protein] reductase